MLKRMKAEVNEVRRLLVTVNSKDAAHTFFISSGADKTNYPTE
jgi:hypothetical protein